LNKRFYHEKTRKEEEEKIHHGVERGVNTEFHGVLISKLSETFLFIDISKKKIFKRFKKEKKRTRN